jgi:cyclophilin family peptidyl-prolyl cis-trans isomerase
MHFRNWLSLLLVVCLLTTAVMAQDPVSGTPEEICAAAIPSETPAERQFAAAEQVLETGVDYRAIFCTGAGAVYVDLFEKLAPVTVNNFVFLAQQGYYNNSVFHRVIQDFMAQGGDPVGDPAGTGGPGYQFEDEFVGFLTFDRPGLLAMANAGPGTNGSQFFLTTAATDWLNYRHTIFGDVLEGYDNVLAIEIRDPQTATTPGTSLDTIVIVTDPASVETTFTEETTTATAEEVFAALSTLTAADALPTDLIAPEDSNGIVTTEELTAQLPEELQELGAEYLADYKHQFRVSTAVINESCNPQYGFTALGYSVDAFETSADASAAISDDRLDEIMAAQGLTPTDSTKGARYYTQATTDCSEAPGTVGRLFVQRGRYMVIVTGVFADAVLQQVELDELLASQTIYLFEQFMASIYRSAIR